MINLSNVQGITRSKKISCSMCHFIKMSNAKCVVARCRSEKRNDVNLSFHQFPSNPDLKSKWIRAILRNGGLSKGDEHDYSLKTDCVCSLHFQTTSQATQVIYNMLM